MSSFPRGRNDTSEGFAWRVAGFFADDDRVPTLEISPELADQFDPEDYVPSIGEVLIEMGMMFMRYEAEKSKPEPKRRPSPRPRPKAVEPEEKDEPAGGFYL